MKTLKDFNVDNKRVLVRCDFNLPLDENGEIEDDSRIKETLPTINYLIGHKAKTILMSHLGDPKGKFVKELRMNIVKDRLEKLLKTPVTKMDTCIGPEIEEKVSNMEFGEIILLENLRFYKEEEENDPLFAKELSKLADIYINDAFSVCHRNHASISGVPKFVDSGAGLLLEKEVKVFSTVLKNPWRPLVVVVGGVKIETKIKVLAQFLKIADHILIGGEIANTILSVKGICIGRPWPSTEIVKEIDKIKITSTKVHLPQDVLVSPSQGGEGYVRAAAPGKARTDELILDIGPETIRIFKEIIKSAKMIVWSGPMGFFEHKVFEKGTKEIGESIIRNHKAYKIVGGGNTLYAIEKFKLKDKFDHISTGGGAMLAYLSGDELPGLKALEHEK